MSRVISVRVSEDLYIKINKMLECSCFNLSWLIRFYLVHLVSYYDTLVVDELVQSVPQVADENRFFNA